MENLTTTTSLTTGEAAAAGAILGSMFSAFLICGLIFYVLTVIAGWKIFQKAGEKGWKALIPIYDIYIMFKIVNMKSCFWFMVCTSILASIILNLNHAPNFFVTTADELLAYNWVSNPVVLITTVFESIVILWISILGSWRLSKVFGHGVGYFIGLFFLPNIFWLILGFGKSKYNKKALN